MRNEERDLARTLHDRAHDVGGHPIGLDAVRADARRMQRRRRVATAAVAVAVAAVAVPVGLNLTGGSTDSTGPVGQPTATRGVTQTASSTPSPSPSASAQQNEQPPAQDAGTPVVVADLKGGAAPGLPWLDGTTLHHDGTTDTLPAAYDNVAAYHGGWLAYGNGQITRIDGSGTVTGSTPGGDIVASDDGLELAWVESGALHTGLANGHSDMEPTQDLPSGTSATAVGFLQGGKLVYDVEGSSPSVHATDLNGDDTVIPGLLKSWGVSQSADLVGGETKVNADGTSCWQVSGPSGAEIWHTCDWALGAFSPDGRYVVGTPSDGDGLGSSRVALLDAHSGKVAATFSTSGGAFLQRFAWEDGEHMLATAHDGGQWTVVRLGVDGSVDRAAPLKAGADTDPPYHLALR
jgi:hypothetical protein